MRRFGIRIFRGVFQTVFVRIRLEFHPFEIRRTIARRRRQGNRSDVHIHHGFQRRRENRTEAEIENQRIHEFRSVPLSRIAGKSRSYGRIGIRASPIGCRIGHLNARRRPSLNSRKNVFRGYQQRRSDRLSSEMNRQGDRHLKQYLQRCRLPRLIRVRRG